MSWLKLDDGYDENEKVAELSDAAFRVDIQGCLYASRAMTDGAVPLKIAKRWRAPAIAELVAARRWHEGHGCDTDTCIRGSGAGYVIHDFLEFNPSKSERQSKQDAARTAARMRWASESHSASQSESSAPTTRGRDGTVRGRERKKEHPRFAEFYDAYPRHVGRRAASNAFDKAIVGGVEPDVIVAAAQAVRNDPNLPVDRTKIPYPATWLNRDGWLDEPYEPPSNGAVSEDSSARLRRLGIVQESTG